MKWVMDKLECPSHEALGPQEDDNSWRELGPSLKDQTLQTAIVRLMLLFELHMMDSTAVCKKATNSLDAHIGFYKNKLVQTGWQVTLKFSLVNGRLLVILI